MLLDLVKNNYRWPKHPTNKQAEVSCSLHPFFPASKRLHSLLDWSAALSFLACDWPENHLKIIKKCSFFQELLTYHQRRTCQLLVGGWGNFPSISTSKITEQILYSVTENAFSIRPLLCFHPQFIIQTHMTWTRFTFYVTTVHKEKIAIIF